MATEAKTGSILAIDVGTINTRAILLDTVDGVYRFVARGVAGREPDDRPNPFGGKGLVAANA